MSDFKIIFNNQDLLSGITNEMPFITRAQTPIDMPNRWGIVESLNFDGYVLLSEDYACSTGKFQNLYAYQGILAKRLAQRFGSLGIVDDDDIILYTGEMSEVRDLSFSESTFVGYVQFNFSIDVYDPDCWRGQYGVLDPSDETSYTLNGAEVEVSHSVSCRGFNTQNNISNALNNAKSFVHSRTGILEDGIFTPSNANGLVLKSLSESVNPFNFTYGITESYIYNTGQTDGTYYKLSYDYSSGVNFSEVSLDGEIVGGLDGSMDVVRNKFHALDFYSLASDYFSEFETGALNSGIENLSVTEKYQDNTLSFSLTYTNNGSGDPYMVDDYTITEDLVGGTTCVSFKGQIESKVGCQAARLQRIKNYYSTVDFESLIKQEFSGLGYVSTLSPIATTQSYSENPSTPAISVNYEYCSRPDVLPYGIEELNYSYDVNPSINKYVAKPSQARSGYYIVQDLNSRTRATVNVNGNGRFSDLVTNTQGMNALSGFINSGISQNFTGMTPDLLDSQNYQWDKLNKSKAFSFSVQFSDDCFQWCSENFRISGQF